MCQGLAWGVALQLVWPTTAATAEPRNASSGKEMAVAPPKTEAVAQATVPAPKGPGDAAKEQGNAHFKAKEYLKAAAS